MTSPPDNYVFLIQVTYIITHRHEFEKSNLKLFLEIYPLWVYIRKNEKKRMITVFSEDEGYMAKITPLPVNNQKNRQTP
jgi:hypothetical protein